jgi:hypothetical protein
LQQKIPANTSQSTDSLTSSKTAEPAEKYDVKRRDWSSLLIDFDTDAQAKKADDTTVSADQVMESLGLKAVVPGLQNRVGATSTGRKDAKPKSKLEEKQALEEVMTYPSRSPLPIFACPSNNLQGHVMFVYMRPTVIHEVETLFFILIVLSDYRVHAYSVRESSILVTRNIRADEIRLLG